MLNHIMIGLLFFPSPPPIVHTRTQRKDIFSYVYWWFHPWFHPHLSLMLKDPFRMYPIVPVFKDNLPTGYFTHTHRWILGEARMPKHYVWCWSLQHFSSTNKPISIQTSQGMTSLRHESADKKHKHDHTYTQSIAPYIYPYISSLYSISYPYYMYIAHISTYLHTSTTLRSSAHVKTDWI
jgi:hypothetical protein